MQYHQSSSSRVASTRQDIGSYVSDVRRTNLELEGHGGALASRALTGATAGIQVLEQLIHEVAALLDGVLEILRTDKDGRTGIRRWIMSE